MMTKSDEEYGREQRAYHRAYNNAAWKAMNELRKRYPVEYQELLKKYRDQPTKDQGGEK